MKNYVLDSYSIIAYLEGEESGKNLIPVLESALEGKAKIYLSAINWGEVYFIALREGGKELADKYLDIISKYPIEIIKADEHITLIAAKFKAFYKISYADAYAAALAEMKKAVLVTGDKEFKQIEKSIKLLWLNE